MKKILVLAILLLASLPACASYIKPNEITYDNSAVPSLFSDSNMLVSSGSHKYLESSYQQAWCSAHNGIEEFKNSDFTRVDCLTETHAVEFDFARKWAESIGQALYYQHMTGKKAKVVLILENPEKEMKYFERVKTLGELHNFDYEYVTESLLNLIKSQ